MRRLGLPCGEVTSQHSHPNARQSQWTTNNQTVETSDEAVESLMRRGAAMT